MARSGGIWKGSISFGLLNIPVNLQTANESKDLNFHMLDSRDFGAIKYKKVNANSGKEVPYDKIVKGYEYEPDEFVIINKADFTAANPKATQTIDIEDFVMAEEIDTMLFDRPYYLIPQKNGEKGYFLLRDALIKTKKVAIGKVVIRTKQHLAAIMPKGDYLILELLRFSHEVKQIKDVDFLEDVKTSGRYNPRELKMAEELIKGMTAKWKPAKYDDTYFEDMMKLIQKKIKAGKTHVIDNSPAEVDDEEDSGSSVTDLLPLLRQSLAKKGSGGSKSPATKSSPGKSTKTAKAKTKSGRGRRESAG